MTQELALSTVATLESTCKSKLENAINEVLGIKANLSFNAEPSRMYGYHIECVDNLGEVNELMTANPFLRQLFSYAHLRVYVFVEETAFFFNIGVNYKHNYRGGSNGHDLMAVCIDKETGEVQIGK